MRNLLAFSTQPFLGEENLYYMKKYLGYFLLMAGFLIILAVFYVNSRVGDETRTFSTYTVLSSSWEKYKTEFINSDGRVIDHTQQGITTSEGQSYALLRAVFLDDKTTFDKVWHWTKDDLQKRGDNLFAWKWGKLQDGSYGFLENGGFNSASDADTDIALALILAGQRWHNDTYTNEAKTVLSDIWDKETDIAAGKRYLIAGPWAKDSGQIIVNPSYFAPYAWRIFAKVDTKHDWNSMVDPAYDLLNRISSSPLDKDKSVGLPPDWVAVHKETGEVMPATMANFSSNYSYDAMRVPWRVALDYQWNKDPKAYDYLKNNFAYLSETYQNTGQLPDTISHNGATQNVKESPAMYATALGYFSVVNKNLANKIYEEKVIALYSNDTNSFRKDLPYYDQNWLWFGTALYNGYLKANI